MKKGVQTAICCPCGNEKILALGLCATCYTLRRQDAEYFGGLREHAYNSEQHPQSVGLGKRVQLLHSAVPSGPVQLRARGWDIL